MSRAFYKTSDRAVLAALAAYESQVDAVRAAGAEFAGHFGGKMVATSGLHGCSVVGLIFSPAKTDPLWTKPDAQRANMQRPRATVKGATKEQKAALAELAADWNARFPSAKADLDPVLSAAGTDWGNLFFCGFDMFQHDGAVYVSTSAPLAPCMVEILSSEYSAAKAAYNLAKEAA